ncbi:MAG: hypothetical protein M3R61_19470 [Chloroflexota bacterium]|nr:hypothetical protein [Chloroflexota bacterium]
MRLASLLRYGIWCGVLATAEGNRREYHMTSTWLPHLATNTISLLLPDIYQLVARAKPAPAHNGSMPSQLRQVVGSTLKTMISDNPAYVLYVTPLALGYLLSSPWLNIYKGDLAEKRLAGFGLDALPHAMTAFALTALTADTARVLGDQSSSTAGLADLGDLTDRYKTLISAIVLVAATIMWELGEYHIYRYELGRRGSREQINMQWSVSDTAYDCAANVIGWLLATGWRMADQRRPG